MHICYVLEIINIKINIEMISLDYFKSGANLSHIIDVSTYCRFYEIYKFFILVERSKFLSNMAVNLHDTSLNIVKCSFYYYDSSVINIYKLLFYI